MRGGDGAEVIYALRNNNTLSNLILSELSDEGQNIRKNYQQRLPSNPSKDYYFIHRNTPDTEALIVEYGFLDSKADDVNQLKNNYKEYAEAVIRAIAKYKNIDYFAPKDSQFYTVQKGDSLWKISKKFGIEIEDIKKLNNLKDNTLIPGQTLKINKEKEKIVEDYLIYTVKSGDSLYKIANEYKTTIDTIKDINNLKNNNLSINQQLLLPKNEKIEIDIEKEQGILYTIKPGDSLWKIANTYGTSVEKIKTANKLTSDNLSIGEQLLIPISDTSVIEKEDENTSKDGINYVVVKGDNLYTIANKYGITVSDIKEANNLQTNTLKIGQILNIPGTETYATYIVKEGDTLFKIANTYGVSVNDLKTINNLDSTLLTIGKQLLIPTKN